MTAPGIAGAAAWPQPRLQKPHDPPVSSASSKPDFFRTLQDRTALTDPSDPSDPGGIAGDAPMAVSFDRGDMFGRSIDLAHQPEAQPASASSALKADPANPPVEAAVSAPDSGFGTTSSVVSSDRLMDLVPGNGRAVTGLHRVIPSFGASGAQTGSVVDGLDTPAIAAPARPDAKRIQPTERQSGMGRAGQPGANLRQVAVELLAPVNVVVRPTPAGVQVSARIGGLRTGDDAEAESAIADAVQDEDILLTELHLNGREIRRSGTCH